MNRPSMLANIGPILNHLRKNESAGQESLFGYDDAADLKMIELPDWDDDTKLYYERKALGCFLSSHPVLLCQNKWETAATHTCSKYYEMTQLPNSRIVVPAFIEKMEVRPRIAFLKVSDHTGQMDIMTFRDDYDRMAHCLRENNVVAFKLRPRYRESTASMQFTDAHFLYSFSPNLAK